MTTEKQNALIAQAMTSGWQRYQSVAEDEVTFRNGEIISNHMLVGQTDDQRTYAQTAENPSGDLLIAPYTAGSIGVDTTVYDLLREEFREIPDNYCQCVGFVV